MRNALRAALGFGVGLLVLGGGATTAKAYFCPEYLGVWEVDNLVIHDSYLFMVEGPGDSWNTVCHYRGWYENAIRLHVEKVWLASASEVSEP